MSFSWITYDSEADALYIHLQPHGNHTRTRELDDQVSVDVDSDGDVLGIEILCPSEELIEAIGL